MRATSSRSLASVSRPLDLHLRYSLAICCLVGDVIPPITHASGMRG